MTPLGRALGYTLALTAFVALMGIAGWIESL